MYDVVVFSTLVILVYMMVFFVISLIKKNNSLVDIGYGAGFVLIALLTYVFNNAYTLTQTFITAFIVLWGVRLSYRIGRRNWGREEDFRYKKWREEWGRWVILRSLFQIFLLQGLIIVTISLPVLLSNALEMVGRANILFFVGVMLWTVGFIFEALGDAQLDSFIRKPENKGLIMDKGLWKYTRHPNYFGETVIWWSIWLMSVSIGASIYSIISPILITFLLLKVSGIPLLEKRWEGNLAYEDYKKKTSVFIPWFVKR